MPKVPFANNVVAMPGKPKGPPPSKTMLAMAAAVMHQQGRLVENPQTKGKDGPAK